MGFARWGQSAADANNADYVNQPGGRGKAAYWKQPPLKNTVHTIRFRPGRVDWHAFQPTNPSAPYQSFSSQVDVPDKAGMLVHVNLWVAKGKSSWAGSSLDVSLTNFSFT